jgi:hypothetical protein
MQTELRPYYMLNSVVPFNPVPFVHHFVIYSDKCGNYSTTIMPHVWGQVADYIVKCKNEEVTRSWIKETTFEKYA